MRRSCYIVGGCLAIAVMASACGDDGDTGTGSPGSGGMAPGGGGSSGGMGGIGTGGVPVACPEGCIQICQAGICDCDCSGTGGGAGVGGTATGGAAGSGGTSGGGTGGSDCQCPSAVWEPVCGVDGNTYNAVCGADCIPVDIACVGECPCDAGGASCDIGCAAPVDASWCESPTVAWECGGIDYLALFVEIGCQELPTGMVRYCCPAGFLSACQ